MCTELQQGSAAACDTNVPYRGEVGKLWALRVQILLLWKIGRSPWGPQHWSTKSLGNGRRERERRGGLCHICRSNCWKRTLKTSLLLRQGWFLIINKIPPRGEGRWLCASASQLTTGAITAGTNAPLLAGWDPQGGLHPRRYPTRFSRRASANVAPHQVSGQPAGKAERRRSLQLHSVTQAFERIWALGCYISLPQQIFLLLKWKFQRLTSRSPLVAVKQDIFALVPLRSSAWVGTFLLRMYF